MFAAWVIAGRGRARGWTPVAPRRRGCVLGVIIATLGCTALPVHAQNCTSPNDVNCDGHVSIADIEIIASDSNFMSLNPQNPRADVNGDSAVNVADMAAVAPAIRCGINAPPVAVAGPDVTVAPGTTVMFDAGQSSDPDGQIHEYAWDFGDGEFAYTAQAGHTFVTSGTYTVALTVTDNCNTDASASLIVEVQDPNVLTADFTISSPAEVQLPVTFSAIAPSELVAFYTWSFSDGKSGSGRTYTRSFPYAGTYAITLRVYAYSGEILSQTKTVLIMPGFALITTVQNGLVNEPRGFAVRNGVAWVAGDIQALATAVVGTPTGPIEMDERILPGAPWDVAVTDALVAIASAWTGVHLFNSGSHDSLDVPAGHIQTYEEDGSYAYHVALLGHILLVATDDLKVYDVAEPADPVALATWEGTGSLRRIELIGEQAYIYDTGVSGYQIMNAVDLLAPEENGVPDDLNRIAIAVLETTTMPGDIAYEGGLLATAEGPQGVGLFDISDPLNPIALAYVAPSSSGTKGVALRGNFLYASEGSRIQKLNISNPANPTLWGTVALDTLVFDLQFDGAYLYAGVANGVAAILRP